MNTPLPGVRATAQPTGLIDVLQVGFDLVNRNLWLLLIPLIIDLLIWLGPQLTVSSLLQQLMADAVTVARTNTEGPTAVEEQAQAVIGAIRESEGLSRYNVLSLIAVPLLGVPTFASEGAGRGPALPLGSLGVAAGLSLVVLAVGLALATLFYGLLGQAVRVGKPSLGSFRGDFWPLLARVVGLFAILVALFGAFGIPAGLTALLPDSSGLSFRSIVGSVFLGISLWLFVYFSFAPDAIYVSQFRSIEAMRTSWRIVRYNFWSAIAIIGLMSIIGGGLSIVWTGLAKMLQEPGVVLAICGHIYISTGLAAASMAYYKERFDRLPRAQTVPNLE
jgi:hypothetical protein